MTIPRSSLATGSGSPCAGSPCGQPLATPVSLVSSVGQRVDSSSGSIGVSPSLGGLQSSTTAYSACFPTTWFWRGLLCSRPRDFLSPQQAGCGGGPRPLLPGVLRSVFVVPKSSGGWRPFLNLSPLNRFLRHRMETAASTESSETSGLGIVCRSCRRLLPCPCSSSGPQMLALRVEGQSFSVSSSKRLARR